MSERQQVWKLMMFELKKIKPKHILNFLLFTIIAILFFSEIMFSSVFLEGERAVNIALDAIFFGYSISVVMYLRSKSFKLQSLKGGLYSAPFMVVLRTLPLSEKAIVKSRISLFLLMSFLISTIHMIIIYFVSTELRVIIPLEQLLYWIIIWNMVTASIGMFMTMSEPGSTYTRKYLVTFNVIFYGVLIVALTALVRFSGNGVFGWILYFSSEHTISTMFIAIALAVSTVIFVYHYMNHYMKKVDYHV
ncbi:hypothetical protein ACI2JA_18005 [Alkalihalobacillus sp. NPDC078783]